MAKKKSDLVAPEEHAEATEGVDPRLDVSDPEVPNDVEIASRGADMDTPANSFTKVFVLGPNPFHREGNPYTAESGFDHEPNKTATRQYAIDAGCWPTGDARFVSSKSHPDGESWIVTYDIPVIPAHDAPTTAEGGTHPEVVGEPTNDPVNAGEKPAE